MSTANKKFSAYLDFNNYLDDSKKFCDMYKLPTPDMPTDVHARLDDFLSIIQEEVEEGKDIRIIGLDNVNVQLAAWADWLGDIVVYSVNEMLRLGLDPRVVLATIMDSNFSKLDTDGNPLYDERGKVMKGSNYWKPEPALLAYINQMREEI